MEGAELLGIMSFHNLSPAGPMSRYGVSSSKMTVWMGTGSVRTVSGTETLGGLLGGRNDWGSRSPVLFPWRCEEEGA